MNFKNAGDVKEVPPVFNIPALLSHNVELALKCQGKGYTQTSDINVIQRKVL